MQRHLVVLLAVPALISVTLSPAEAETPAEYLDRVLSAAYSEATADQAKWVEEEKSTREARRAEGDAARVAYEETKKAGEKAAALRQAAEDAEKKRREAERKARDEEERRQEMAEAYERERRRDELARQRAADRAAGQNDANQIIMDAINRNAQGIADAYRTGQNAVAAANREKARIEAERAARAAEAQYQRERAAAQRAQADREAKARMEAAARRAEEAREAAERAKVATGSQQQVATNTTVTSSAPRQAPSASSPGTPRMAANASTSAEPAKTYRRVESLTYCTYKTEQRPADGDVEWLCDGPTQKLQLKNKLSDGLRYTGCGNANTTTRRQTVGRGDIFYCEKAIAPYDRDIASIYNVPATVRGHRHVYECKQTSDTCTRETAVKFIAGGGL